MSFIDLVSSSDEEDVIEIIPLPNYPPNPAAATFPPPFSSQTKDGKDGDGYEDKMSSRLYMEANPHAHASLDDSSSSSASSSSSSLLPVPNKYHPTNTTTAPSPPTGSCSGSGSSLGININTQKLDAYLEAQAAALGGGDSAGSGARVSTNIDPTYEQTVQRMQQESEAKIKQARLWSRQQEEFQRQKVQTRQYQYDLQRQQQQFHQELYQRSQVGLLAAQQQQRGNGEMSVGLDGKGYTNTGGSAQGYGHEQGHGHDLLLDVPEGKASFTPYVVPTSASTGATRNSFTSQPSRRILPSSLTGSADIHPSTSQMYPTYAVNPQAHTAYIPMSTIIFTLINLKQFSVKASEGGRIDDRLLPLMQSIPSFTYDPRKQIILFPLTSHEQLVNSLQETIPLLLVESLPRHVITAAIIRQEKEERYKHKNSAAVKERDVAVDQALRVVYKIPQQVMDNLAQFQREAVHFVCDNTMYTNPVDGMPCQGNNGRALIADEMGLGKTRSAIGCIFAYVTEWPVLIVVPSSARHHWRQELITCTDTVLDNKGEPLLPSHLITIVEGGSHPVGSSVRHRDYKIVIISYNLLDTMYDGLRSMNFGVLVLDECHYLKSVKAKRTKAILPFTQQCKRVIMLSGTPALSRPMELYSQISMLRPDKWNDSKEFGLRYCRKKKKANKKPEQEIVTIDASPRVSNDGQRKGHIFTEKQSADNNNNNNSSSTGGVNTTITGGKIAEFSGACNTHELHLILTDSIMIRRLKKHVLSSLPPKQRRVVEVPIVSTTLRLQLVELLARVRKLEEKAKKNKLLKLGIGLGKAAEGNNGADIGNKRTRHAQSKDNDNDKDKGRNWAWEKDEHIYDDERERSNIPRLKAGYANDGFVVEDSSSSSDEDSSSRGSSSESEDPFVYNKKIKAKSKGNVQGNAISKAKNISNDHDGDVLVDTDTDADADGEKTADTKTNIDAGICTDTGTCEWNAGLAVAEEDDQIEEKEEDIQKSRVNALMKLFATTGIAKLPAILEHLTVFLDSPSSSSSSSSTSRNSNDSSDSNSGGKILIFAHHRSVIEGLSEFLEEREARTENRVGRYSSSSSRGGGNTYIKIDGRTPPADRQALVGRFQNDPYTRVAVLAITAAGVAITLTAASTVWFAEMYWTPGSLVQAEDRAHRIGQIHTVHVIYFLSNGTVDELLWPLVREKMKSLGEIVEGHATDLLKPYESASASSSSSSSSASSSSNLLPWQDKVTDGKGKQMEKIIEKKEDRSTMSSHMDHEEKGNTLLQTQVRGEGLHKSIAKELAILDLTVTESDAGEEGNGKGEENSGKGRGVSRKGHQEEEEEEEEDKPEGKEENESDSDIDIDSEICPLVQRYIRELRITRRRREHAVVLKGEDEKYYSPYRPKYNYQVGGGGDAEGKKSDEEREMDEISWRKKIQRLENSVCVQQGEEKDVVITSELDTIMGGRGAGAMIQVDDNVKTETETVVHMNGHADDCRSGVDWGEDLPSPSPTSSVSPALAMAMKVVDVIDLVESDSD